MVTKGAPCEDFFCNFEKNSSNELFAKVIFWAGFFVLQKKVYLRRFFSNWLANNIGFCPRFYYLCTTKKIDGKYISFLGTRLATISF